MQNYLVVTLSGVIFLTFIELILPKGSMKEVSKMVTSLIIVVGVAIETFRQMETQAETKEYKGFLD